MHLIPRRLSPSLVLAALFVALAGTATAAVIISSPDQLTGNVITSPRIVDGAVSQSDERNPSLRARIDRFGKVIAGDVPGGVVEHPKRGQYNVTMSLGDVGPLGLDTCGVSAYANLAPGSAQVNVFVVEQGSTSGASSPRIPPTRRSTSCSPADRP